MCRPKYFNNSKPKPFPLFPSFPSKYNDPSYFTLISTQTKPYFHTTGTG